MDGAHGPALMTSPRIRTLVRHPFLVAFLGLGLPIVAFIVPLQAFSHGQRELLLERVDEADARAHVVTDQEFLLFPPALQRGISLGIDAGKAVLVIDPIVAKTLARLRVEPGGPPVQLVYRGAAVLMQIAADAPPLEKALDGARVLADRVVRVVRSF